MVATYAAAPHHGGRNNKLKNFITVIPSGNTLPPRPDADVEDCDGPLVRIVNTREPAELIRLLVF